MQTFLLCVLVSLALAKGVMSRIADEGDNVVGASVENSTDANSDIDESPSVLKGFESCADADDHLVTEDGDCMTIREHPMNDVMKPTEAEFICGDGVPAVRIGEKERMHFKQKLAAKDLTKVLLGLHKTVVTAAGGALSSRFNFRMNGHMFLTKKADIPFKDAADRQDITASKNIAALGTDGLLTIEDEAILQEKTGVLCQFPPKARVMKPFKKGVVFNAGSIANSTKETVIGCAIGCNDNAVCQGFTYGTVEKTCYLLAVRPTQATAAGKYATSDLNDDYEVWTKSAYEKPGENNVM